jgi:hypothetical protein
VLIFTTERNPSHLVHAGRKIPVYKSKGVDDDGKTVVGGVANVPFEVRAFLVGHPHWKDYEGQVELPGELQSYAEGDVGDPVLEDFESTESGEKGSEPEKRAADPLKELKARAKELGIQGYTKMNSDELTSAIEEAGKKPGTE